jgi:uncharacterized protein with von Willebrand factor type A (vWA) domain
MHVCRFHHEDRGLEPGFREALETALYEFFVSPDAEVEPPADVPASLAELVGEIARGCDYRAVTAGVPELAEKVAHEAVEWCDQRWAEVDDEDPFEGEESELAVFRVRTGETADPEHVRNIVRRLWARYPEVSSTWHTYDRAGEDAAAAGGELGAVKSAALARRVAATWLRLLTERRRRFERAFLMHALPRFIDRLNREVPLMARAGERVRDFFGESARSWDLLHGGWRHIGWDGLEQAAGALGEEPTVRRLAELLGRAEHVPQEFTEETWEEITERRTVDVEALGRSEIEGVSLGSNVESIIPAERALLADPATELVFSKRFADDELLSFDYRSAREVEHTNREVKVRSRLRPLERGPIIACVDTSGSMTGRPERVAKAIILALARVAAADERPCYVIAFSTRVRTFELADFSELPELSAFLGYSFHGGTDLRPALEETLSRLETTRYERADVLVVSDFRVPKLLERQTARIGAAQSELGTLFHSLTVAEAPPVDPLHIFDFHWHYDTSTREGGITGLAQV